MSTFDREFTSPTVPAFLTKLRLLVDDEETNDLIFWDLDGASFHICDGNRLAKEILPLFFKHNNLSSFIRQLNMYGFRKVNRVDPTVALKSELEDMEFKHPCFLRSKPHLLSKIQRKPHTNLASGFLFNGRNGNAHIPSFLCGTGLGQSSFSGLPHSSRPATNADVERLYAMVRGLRSNQETMNNQLTLVQSENQLLYRELTELRERHEQQSQLIQTLFTFLSAFAKDGKSPNFRWGPNKRRALPFIPSQLFSTQSHSGLKLNLPQGFQLDDYTETVHPLQLATADESLPSPYKIAKMDFRALPANVQEVTRCLSPHSPETLNQSISQYTPRTQLHPVPSTSLQGSQRVRSSYSNRLHHVDIKHAAPYAHRSDTTVLEKEIVPDDATSHVPMVSTVVKTPNTSPIVIRPQEQTKPALTSNEDMTMTSLTNAPSNPDNPTSPLVAVGANTSVADAPDNSLADLNLSRCTTPVSLIQPDSVDLTEFLAAATGDAAADEDEPLINMDDLFLASAALETSSAESATPVRVRRRSSKPGQSELSFEGAPSLDTDGNTDATINLPDICAEEVVSSGCPKASELIEQLEAADLDQINMEPISDSSSTEVDSLSQCGAGSKCPKIRSPLTTPAHQVNSNESELFGLPWEDDLVVEDHEDGELSSSLNAGLLPPPQEDPARLRLLTRNSLESIKSRLPFQTNQQHSFIRGNEIIPAESAAPFANVSMAKVVQILQPTFVPVSTVCAETANSAFSTTTTKATDTAPVLRAVNPTPTGSSISSDSLASASPPLIRSKFQPRPFATVLPRTVTNNPGVVTATTVSSTNGISGVVSSNPCVIPVLPLTTVALGQQMLATTTHPVTIAMPAGTAMAPSQPVRSVVRSTPVRKPTIYKKIAPAPLRTLKPSAGSAFSNQSAVFPDLPKR